MNKYLDRIEVLVGKENIKKLKKKKVLICGVGGVGSFGWNKANVWPKSFHGSC